jgi:hypothetical protein
MLSHLKSQPYSVLLMPNVLLIVQTVPITLIHALLLGCGRTDTRRPLKDSEAITNYINVTGIYQWLTSRAIFNKRNCSIRRD